MRRYFLVQPYEGWAGFVDAPEFLDLKAAQIEFRNKYYSNPHAAHQDEWYEQSEKNTDTLKAMGLDGWDYDSLFISWLCKEKACVAPHIESLLVYETDRYDDPDVTKSETSHESEGNNDESSE